MSDNQAVALMAMAIFLACLLDFILDFWVIFQ
jgi:hypothetical protein